MNLREYTEELEIKNLSKYAAKSRFSAGRDREEKKCDIRTDYQRDRDRITHCKSFRRLMHKTQVFISPEGDHYRTRLTHTLEVNQIARTIARALRLNEDLTEAIALGHDLGHTPFGHTGEEALNSILIDGFRHNEQSVRVVSRLEKNGAGLNLTEEVLDGILNHRGHHTPSTLEGKIVQISDKIAYINHDIEDACRAQILAPGDLPKECTSVLGDSTSSRIGLLIRNVIKNSAGVDDVKLEPKVYNALMKLRKFMFDQVYSGQLQQAERVKIQHMLEDLYRHYKSEPDVLPEMYRKMIASGETQNRVICDYIAGMTDRFAMKQFVGAFVPAEWNM